MARRGENIYKRKDGRWEGRYIKGKNSEGKATYGQSLAKQFEDGIMPEHEIAEAISNISNSRRRKIVDEIHE